MLRGVYVIGAVGCLTRGHTAGFQYFRPGDGEVCHFGNAVSVRLGTARPVGQVLGVPTDRGFPKNPHYRQSDQQTKKTGTSAGRHILEATLRLQAPNSLQSVWRDHPARVVELADTADSKSVAFQERAGSSPAPGTKYNT